MGVQHHTGLPYNPQGQGIVERTNRSLKELLQKQKGGIGHGLLPRNVISLATFTLNFLTLDDKDRPPADKHANMNAIESTLVKWKDVLKNKWSGPDLVIARSREAVCVFPQDQKDPIWVPVRVKIAAKDEDNPVDENDTLGSNEGMSRTNTSS